MSFCYLKIGHSNSTENVIFNQWVQVLAPAGIKYFWWACVINLNIYNVLIIVNRVSKRRAQLVFTAEINKGNKYAKLTNYK